MRPAGPFQETVITAVSNVYTSPRVAPLLVLGFASGLPLALTSGTLQAWATVAGVPLQQIGFLTLVGTAYTLKFLWALLAVLVAFLSATQDIAFDAYCTDVLRKEERGAGAAIKVMGYRVAMIVSGGLALILADQWIGWGNTYVVMGGLMLLCALATLWAPEPEHVAKPPRSLGEAVSAPLQEFFTRRGALAVLLLIVLYKLGDAFAGALSTTFLIRGAGYTPTEVGAVNKVMGMAATVVGALAGGLVMSRWTLYRSLMVFGLLQAVSNLGYWVIAVSPKSIWLMGAAVGLENLCGGLGTAAFVGLLMALCRQRFSATQFALLSALSAVGRTYLAGPLTPPLVEHLGWPGFFLVTVVIALPGLVLLHLLRGRIEAMMQDGDA